jgi:uncharacterized repeat protein (TIGR04076 family)
MIPNRVRCQAVAVRTESKVCPGLAKTEQGETYVLDARTPGPRGICCQAFAAMSAQKLALMVTEKIEGENPDGQDITCPHGAVTFRLSRMN